MSGEPQFDIPLMASEVNALKKAIMYLKFSCKDPSSDIFAASPFINNVLKKLLDAYNFGGAEMSFYEKSRKNNKTHILEKMAQKEAYSREVYNREAWSEDVKKKIFEAWMYPLRITGD